MVDLFILAAAKEDLSRERSGDVHWLPGVADIFEGCLYRVGGMYPKNSLGEEAGAAAALAAEQSFARGCH